MKDQNHGLSAHAPRENRLFFNKTSPLVILQEGMFYYDSFNAI